MKRERLIGWISGLDNIAHYMGMSRSTLSRLDRELSLPILRLGGKYYAHPANLDAWYTFLIKKTEERDKR